MIVFDIETDGLIPDLTKIHCINMVDRSTGQRLRFNDQPLVVRRAPDGTVAEAVRLLQEADEIAGHNVINFDIPAIQKVYSDFLPAGRVIDTLVYSRIIWTNIRDIDLRAIKRRKRPPEWETGCTQNGRAVSCTGRHSLGAWGFRLGEYKGDFPGPWDTFTADMDDYCAQDVEVTVKLIEKVEAEGYSPQALDIELRVADIIEQQVRHGFLFDVMAARKLEVELVSILADLEDKLREAFKPWFVPERHKGAVIVTNPKKRRKVKIQYEDNGPVSYIEYEPDAPYSKVKLVSFEPGSRDKIADRLSTLFGWRPQEFTETGKPKVDETTLAGLDWPEAKLLKEYLLVAKRLGFLSTGDNGLLKKVDADGRIHGRVNTNGAVTGRMTHSTPNLAQVPTVKVGDDDQALKGLEGGYGWEFRSLFIVAALKKLVGVDAEGLELRMLAHYMARYDGGAYVETVVNGKKSAGTDVHTVNQKVVGLNSRYNAKTWMYAYLYGAGNWKLGSIVYDDMTDAQRSVFNAKYPPGDAREQAFSQLGARGRSRIETGLPALGALQAQVKATAKEKGFLRSLDGRKLHVRAQHSALNTLLQGGGAIVMKLALVLAYDAFLDRGWEFGKQFAFVVNVHDEFQTEADEDIAEEIGSIAAEAIRRAGEAFNLRCPLSGSADIGLKWADSH